MNRQIVVRLTNLLLIAVFCWCIPFSGAQEQTSEKKPAEQVQKPVNAYRLDFSVNEMEDGKKINTRQYSMNLSANNDFKEIKIGTRVPIETKQGEYQYLDIGTNIRARIKEQENGLLLDVSCEISRIADPEQAKPGFGPIIQRMNINASTVASVGKPTVIGSADDPDSKRQFQLEVTATKLK
jgi:hypothetical protein